MAAEEPDVEILKIKYNIVSGSGISSMLHDNSHGVHLVSETCPTNCYELSLTGAIGETDEEKAQWISNKLVEDGHNNCFYVTGSTSGSFIFKIT